MPTDGLVGVSIDPSRGTILSLLIQTPGLRERVGQGGLVGYVIIASVLSIVGLLFNAGAVGNEAKLSAQVLEDFFFDPSGRVSARCSPRASREADDGQSERERGRWRNRMT